MVRSTVVIVIYIFEMLISFCFFSRIYERKKNIGITILIGLLLYIPSAVIFNLFQNEIINTSVFFLINLAYGFICFDMSVKNAAIQSLMLDTLMMSSEYVTIFTFSVILDFPPDYHKNNLYSLIIYALISKAAYFILSQLLTFVIIKTGHKNKNTGHYLPLFIFPVLSISTGVLFLLMSYQTEMSSMHKVLFAAICVLYIFASVFIFIYYQMFADREAKVNELESEKRLFNLNTAYMELLQHQNNELQMVFHDTKNHYSALNSFDNIEDVKAYISKIYPQLEGKYVIKISSNKMLDLIISKYIVLCRKDNIKFDYEVQTASLDYIEDTELSMILNNILDNAVEAAKASRDRCIEFSLRHVNNMDVLSVVNSCDNPPKHHNKKLITTKFDTDNHGFGSKIIEKYAKKNNGKYEWFYDEAEHRFHLTILFQRKNTETGTL